MASLFFCHKAGELMYTDYVPYLILLIVIVLLDFLALTSWKHRIFQMRTAILASLITLAFQVWLAVDYFTADKELVFKVTAVFPLVSIILNVLAAGNIWGDEMVVRSASRLRAAKRNNTKKK